MGIFKGQFSNSFQTLLTYSQIAFKQATDLHVEEKKQLFYIFWVINSIVMEMMF